MVAPLVNVERLLVDVGGLRRGPRTVESADLGAKRITDVTPEEAFDECVFALWATARFVMLPKSAPPGPKRVEAMRAAIQKMTGALDAVESPRQSDIVLSKFEDMEDRVDLRKVILLGVAGRVRESLLNFRETMQHRQQRPLYLSEQARRDSACSTEFGVATYDARRSSGPARGSTGIPASARAPSSR